MFSWIKSLFTPKARASSQRVPDRIWELAENQPLSLDAQLAVANGRMSMDSVQQAVREGVRKYREQAGTNPVAAWALSFVDPYTWANDTPDFYPGWGVGGGMVPWMLNNQGVGDALPVYINEYGLKLIRDWSRKQLQFNEFAINAVENRINYIVGKGMQYTIIPKKRAESTPTKEDGESSGPKKLAAMAQEVLDEFIVRERWNEREQEIVRRCDRDGESFVRFFHVGNGRCSVRFVEPEYVTDGKATLTDKYGIQTADDDVERPIAYQVVERPTADWVVDPVPAEEILHIKLNTDFTSKRGLPTFFPVRKNLERAEKLLRNMSVMAQVQATFSVIRKHKQFSPSSVSAYQQQQVTLATQNAISGQPVNLQQYYPGSVIDTSDKTEYEFPSAGVDGSGLVLILEAELRAIASRLVMTDWMLTASSQGANVSTALVAGAPCVENFKRMQAFYARRFGDGCYPAPIAGGDSVAGAMWRVLAIAVDGGLLPDEVLTDLEIQAEGPSITVVNKVAESNRARVLYESGILSGETWAKWEGLDYQQELSLGAKPEKAVPGDEGREGEGFGREMPSNPGDRMTGGQDDGGDETRENVKDDSGHEHGDDGRFTGNSAGSSRKSKLAASKKKIADASAALKAARDEAVEHLLGDISDLQDKHDNAVSELKKISKIKRGEGSSDESSEEYKELVDVYGQLTDMIQDYKELHVDMKSKDKVNALEDIRDSSLALADLLKEDGRPDSEVEFAKELAKNATAAAKSIRGIYRARKELKDIKSGKITESVAAILGENVKDDSGHEHGNDGKFVGNGGGTAGSKSRKKKTELHGETESGQKIEFTTPPHMHGRKLVMVDPAKLSKAWEKDKKNYLPPEDSGEKGGSEVGGRRNNFKDFLKKGKPVEASTVFLTKDGEVSFVDGRHRFAVMRDMGIDRVAVAVDKKQASKFEKEFGA